ncbi:tyrosine-type recombinase/integrase [candidate division KSB1 bacterium]
MATLAKRKTKDSFTYVVDYYQNGKRKRRSIGTSDRKLAKKVFDKIKGDLVMENHGVPTAKDTKKILLEDYFEEYLKYSKANKSKNTYLIENNSLKKFINFIGNCHISSITEKDCDRFKSEYRNNGSKPSTVNTYLKSLKTSFQVACKWKYLTENVFKKIDMCRIEENGAPKCYTNEQIRNLLDCIRTEPFRNLILVYLYTGCRRTEALNLVWDDISFDKGTIEFRKTKSKRSRHVPINSKLLPVLKKMYKERKNDDKLFTYCQEYATQGVKRYLREIGIDNGLCVHSLRHTFASTFVMSEGDLYTLKEILGHSSITMTMIYAHLTPDYLKEAMNKVKYE